jgi:hypothetical protein
MYPFGDSRPEESSAIGNECRSRSVSFSRNVLVPYVQVSRCLRSGASADQIL